MKKIIFKLSFFAAAAVLFFTACNKQETLVTVTGAGTAPVLSATIPSGDTIPLIAADSLNTLMTFAWTNPNYTFSDGISSQNVTYYLEVDTLGANFSSPHMQQVAYSTSLSNTFTVGQFNTIIGNGLQVAFGKPHTIQVRIEAFITPLTSGSPAALPLYSNVYTYTVTPFAPPPKITPPSVLYIVGSAVPVSGWNNPITGGAAEVAIQQFTQLSTTLFTITLPLIGGEEYQFIINNGSWTGQCGIATKDDPTEVNGGSFTNLSAQNILAPSASGTYTIVVNFQTGLFTITLQ